MQREISLKIKRENQTLSVKFILVFNENLDIYNCVYLNALIGVVDFSI